MGCGSSRSSRESRPNSHCFSTDQVVESNSGVTNKVIQHNNSTEFNFTKGEAGGLKTFALSHSKIVQEVSVLQISIFKDRLF